MSAFGPKQTSLVALHMSAFGGKADTLGGNSFELDLVSDHFETIPAGRSSGGSRIRRPISFCLSASDRFFSHSSTVTPPSPASAIMSSSLCFFRLYAGSPRTCLACPAAFGSIYPAHLGNQAIA